MHVRCGRTVIEFLFISQANEFCNKNLYKTKLAIDPNISMYTCIRFNISFSVVALLWLNK